MATQVTAISRWLGTSTLPQSDAITNKFIITSVDYVSSNDPLTNYVLRARTIYPGTDHDDPDTQSEPYWLYLGKYTSVRDTIAGLEYKFEHDILQKSKKGDLSSFIVDTKFASNNEISLYTAPADMTFHEMTKLTMLGTNDQSNANAVLFDPTTKRLMLNHRVPLSGGRKQYAKRRCRTRRRRALSKRKRTVHRR